MINYKLRGFTLTEEELFFLLYYSTNYLINMYSYGFIKVEILLSNLLITRKSSDYTELYIACFNKMLFLDKNE